MEHKYKLVMKINSLFVFFLLCFSVGRAQDAEPWKRISQTTDKRIGKSETNNAVLFQLNEEVLKAKLKSIQDKQSLNTTIQITVPNVNGVLEKFSIHEDSNFEPVLQAKYPDIRSYSGTGITDPAAVLNFSMSPSGIQTMITRNGNQVEFIEKDQENKDLYLVFDSKSNLKEQLPFSCTTEGNASLTRKTTSQSARLVFSNRQFKTLRLALSCTGEYAAFHGGTVQGALAAMNNTMTRVNGIFNRDLAVKLEIIANNNLIVYTNPATDPYSGATAR